MRNPGSGLEPKEIGSPARRPLATGVVGVPYRTAGMVAPSVPIGATGPFGEDLNPNQIAIDHLNPGRDLA